MTQSEFSYNKFDYASLRKNLNNYHNDNGDNFPDKTKQWFFIPYDHWFLSHDEKEPMQGNFSWFDSVVNTVKKATKAIKRKRIDFSETRIVIARNPESLKQYYDLREKLYRKKLGFTDYNGQENVFDKTGNVILAIYNEKVIAGARLDFSDCHPKGLMYNDNPEDNGFTYKDIIKKFDPDFREGDIYAEICGLVVDGRVAADFFPRFFEILVNHSKNMDSRYVVGVSYPKLCTGLANIFRSFGYNAMVLDDIEFKIKNTHGNNRLSLRFSPIIIKNY